MCLLDSTPCPCKKRLFTLSDTEMCKQYFLLIFKMWKYCVCTVSMSVPEAPVTGWPAPVAPGRGGLLSCPEPRGASCRRRGWGGGRAAGARSGSSGAAPAPPAARGWGHHPAGRVTGGYRCTGESCQLTDPPTRLWREKYKMFWISDLPHQRLLGGLVSCPSQTVTNLQSCSIFIPGGRQT